MVMDFSWGWVKPGSVTTTEPRAKAMLELARLAIPQAMRHPIVGTRPELVERRGGGPYPRLRLPALPAARAGPQAPAFFLAGRGILFSLRAPSGCTRTPSFFSL